MISLRGGFHSVSMRRARGARPSPSHAQETSLQRRWLRSGAGVRAGPLLLQLLSSSFLPLLNLCVQTASSTQSEVLHSGVQPHCKPPCPSGAQGTHAGRGPSGKRESRPMGEAHLTRNQELAGKGREHHMDLGVSHVKIRKPKRITEPTTTPACPRKY